MLREIEKVKSHELESALMQLPFQEIKILLGFMGIWLERVKVSYTIWSLNNIFS